MLRSELIDKLHTENEHLTRRDVERVVAVVLESVIQTLEQDWLILLVFDARHGVNLLLTLPPWMCDIASMRITHYIYMGESHGNDFRI